MSVTSTASLMAMTGLDCCLQLVTPPARQCSSWEAAVSSARLLSPTWETGAELLFLSFLAGPSPVWGPLETDPAVRDTPFVSAFEMDHSG